MRKKMKIFVIIITLAFSLLNLPITNLVPTAKATYVEGEIRQDTVWTLVDSPFVVSKNLTVCEGATLTIEPGVEVKFGGPFSLIVNGTFVANGTEEKPIKFTSNKEKPETGDWGTILFNGTGQTPSILENCLIEYGTDGVTVKGGTLTIRKSVIQYNSKSGIVLFGGSATVEWNIVQENGNGTSILGGNVVMRNNLVMLNKDGIILAGDLSASNVTITQNKIDLNDNSGVSLGMNVSGIISINNNTVSSNFYGFYISTNASTFITRNYILNNTIGVFYSQGIGHVASFNNICGNTLGMDVASNVTVNAEHNYWGDRSGPYHEMLNPRGKGNPVGGNGANLDFIFFLTAPIDYANNRPTAVLWTDKTLVAPGQEVTFIGSYSYDDGRVDQYLFDFGDENTADWTTLSLSFHTYRNIGNYTASLKVMDDFGSESNPASTLIRVVDLPPLTVELTLSSYTVHRNQEVPVAVYVSQDGSPVENANVTLFAVKGGSFSPSSGLTNSSGYFTTTFKAPNVMDVTNIRIIARASMDGYADGSSYKYLEVLPPLTVDVVAVPSQVLSEELSTINVRVTWNGAPVSEALVAVFSSNGGNFIETEKLTDANGEVAFNFQAPLTTTNINTTITARASKAGYVDGEGEAVIIVMPKVLSVRVSAERASTISEEAVNLTVHVEYEGVPIQGANVTISAEAGEWPPEPVYTNTYGNATVTFRTPPVPQKTNITITATASKIGYASNSASITLTAQPGNLTVNIFPSSYSVVSEKSLSITVNVKCNGKPVENASVTVTANAGTFTATSATTDSNGYCEFSFLAPKTSEVITVTVTVNASKYGYVGATGNVYLTVVPEAAGGIPWMTILLILIPVLLVIVFVVLVKLGIISISMGEEEE
jgi:uncharacterized GH25 family protein